MTRLTIKCIECGVSLKLPDVSLAGKRIKCPKCGNRFVVPLPATVADDSVEVPLQLADSAPPASLKAGTSARWVPDTPPPVRPLAPADPPSIPPNQNIDPALENFLNSALTDRASVPVIVNPEAGQNAGATKTTLHRKRRRGNFGKTYVWVALSAIVTGVLGGSVWFMAQQGLRTSTPSAPQTNAAYQESVAMRVASNAEAKTLSPTGGKAIPVDYLPFTPHVVCHLHPAALWQEDRHTSELQALLSSLGIWLREQIRTRTRFEPEEISELTFAVNFGPRMSAPEVAAVVRLNAPQPEQEMVQRFNGRIYADPQVELYEAADFSFLKIDDRTFVVAPSGMSETLAMSVKSPATLLPEMAALTRQSDRDRHLSLLFDVTIVDAHREDAFIPQLQPLADKFLAWFGKDVQTVSWSLHLEPDLYMETLLHHTQATTPAKLQKFVQRKLANLPTVMFHGVQTMQPVTVGARTMIGRFPAMLKAVEIGTTTHIDSDGVRLITLLPQHAATNLVAATMLTWSQSLLSNANNRGQLTQAAGGVVPERVADRLSMNLLIDFRATPLQEAFGYIGESIRTEVVIDGDALKAAGFTQNMPQTYDLGKVTALKAIDTILKKYASERDPMVLIVDESGQKLMISTATKAKTDGFTVFDTSD
ncbi:MAG: hypothetical protein R3C17_09695 [Planctomycetaceae bacterium]